ncbi:MAG: hypothetical protein WEE89_10710 [Gemmatimonadota bacterium]
MEAKRVSRPDVAAGRIGGMPEPWLILPLLMGNNRRTRDGGYVTTRGAGGDDGEESQDDQ